jgi:hypothetical protein
MGIIEDTITPLSQAELNILHLKSNVGDESAITTSISKALSKRDWTVFIKFWKHWKRASNYT